MDYRVQVLWRDARPDGTPNVPDGRAEAVLDDIRTLGISDVESVRVIDLYFLRGNLSIQQVEHLCRELLVDPVVQGARVSSSRFQVRGSRFQVEDPTGGSPPTLNLQPLTTNSDSLSAHQLFSYSTIQQINSSTKNNNHV